MVRLLLVLSLVSMSVEASPFPNLATDSMAAIEAGLRSCHLQILDAYDPRLPRPQTPADFAVVSPRGRLLAYTIAYYELGTTLAIKSPNGGLVHSVSFGREAIHYVTPFKGTVAHGNRFTTVNGPDYQFYCHSTPVAPAAFLACVKQSFVDVVIAQLCRYGSR